MPMTRSVRLFVSLLDSYGSSVGHLKKIIIICYKLLIFILTNDYMIVTNSLFTCLEKVVKGVTRGSLTA